MSDFAFSPGLRDRIATNLSGLERQAVPDPELRKAAVVIVVTPAPETQEASILITLRPQKLARHGGQYALPGGRLDLGETDEQAGLRELDEELGLSVPPTAVLGRLDDFPTRSGFRIAPLVAWVDDPSKMTPDPGEVSAGLPCAYLR